MWTYYRDVTLYAITICLFFGLATAGVSENIAGGVLRVFLIFSIFGTGLGVLAFGYFQKQQYYMYHNLGFTKRFLIVRAWAINFAIGVILSIVVLPFL